MKATPGISIGKSLFPFLNIMEMSPLLIQAPFFVSFYASSLSAGFMPTCPVLALVSKGQNLTGYGLGQKEIFSLYSPGFI